MVTEALDNLGDFQVKGSFLPGFNKRYTGGKVAGSQFPMPRSVQEQKTYVSCD